MLLKLTLSHQRYSLSSVYCTVYTLRVIFLALILCSLICRHIISTRGTDTSISVASTIFTVRSCSHSENDSWMYRLFFSNINCGNCANILSADCISNRAGIIGRTNSFVMQFPRNRSSSHRNDKVQWNAVITLCRLTVYHLTLHVTFFQSTFNIRMVSTGYSYAYFNHYHIFDAKEANHN